MVDRQHGEATLTWAEAGRLPASFAELADRLGMPVIIVDYQVTRRQRVHVGITDNESEPYTDSNLMGVLEFLWSREYDQACIIYHPNRGETMGAHVAFSPLPAIGDENG